MTIRIFSATLVLLMYLLGMSLFATGAFGEASTDESDSLTLSDAAAGN